MKNPCLKCFAPVMVLSFFFLASCKKDKCTETVTYKTYVPVYMSYDQLRSSVKTEGPQALQNPGKIYLKGNYIFVSETGKGIHVINNSNPSSPQNIAFINIPGNIDMASSGNVLYADSYVDLLALDISNPANVTLLNRVENALPYWQYSGGYNADPAQGVVTDWKEQDVTQPVNTDCSTGGGYIRTPVMYDNATFGGAVVPVTSGTSSSSVSSPGIGGSTARFTLAANVLYTVDDSKLNVYDISAPANPTKVSETTVGWSIQTIFPYKTHLFIGSSSGMYIYDISNPVSPSLVSEYNHITACDPVVVDDQYAYFTLSNDAPCHMGVNQLEVVDITNPAAPTLKTTVPMTNPKGLGIDNKKLFICDSNDGLKVYDATDVMHIANNQVSHFSGINAFDVIPYNNHLLMVGSDGLYQYDYSDLQNIHQISVIPVTK